MENCLQKDPDINVVYTINYANVGDQDATGVTLTQNLPANTTFDAAGSTAGWVDQGGGVYTFDLGNLDAPVVQLLLEHPEEPKIPLARERAKKLRERIPFSG